MAPTWATPCRAANTMRARSRSGTTDTTHVAPGDPRPAGSPHGSDAWSTPHTALRILHTLCARHHITRRALTPSRPHPSRDRARRPHPYRNATVVDPTGQGSTPRPCGGVLRKGGTPGRHALWRHALSAQMSVLNGRFRRRCLLISTLCGRDRRAPCPRQCPCAPVQRRLHSVSRLGPLLAPGVVPVMLPA